MENGGERETIGRTNIENRKEERENGRMERKGRRVGWRKEQRAREGEREVKSGKGLGKVCICIPNKRRRRTLNRSN